MTRVPQAKSHISNDWNSFILKTKEQRAAEKALMDKSPLKTLTLEEFLESERHKLTGTLTPVTPESFAEWKKQRLNKKAAEEQARKAKEATGRMLFESGNWRTEESDVESDDEPDEDEDGDFNLQKLRDETEALSLQKEEERLAEEQSTAVANGETQQDAASPEATEATEAEASTAT